MWPLLLLLVVLLGSALGQEQLKQFDGDSDTFRCPELFGDYADAYQCDYFWRCTNGVAEPMECEDGHAFNPALRGTIYPCDYHFKVDCTGRELLQEPRPGVDPECERQHGVFLDPVLCGTFHTCKNGVATRNQCASPLHVHPVTRECVWPEAVNRSNCDARETLGPFSCPLEAVDAIDFNGVRKSNPTYPNELDCRMFYICLNGIKPVEGGCPEGTVYSIETEKCQDPATVPGCEDYYRVDDNQENFS